MVLVDVLDIFSFLVLGGGEGGSKAPGRGRVGFLSENPDGRGGCLQGIGG